MANIQSDRKPEFLSLLAVNISEKQRDIYEYKCALLGATKNFKHSSL